ncbi:MAG: response regulator transcription factor [Elusimicrobiales bacterium]|nr:response regulator transcription factor [Elusimicrobiales bacterium]
MASGKKILIADDDPDIVDLLETYFIGKKYEVVVVMNGKDALKKVENEKFDIILLDVMMPYIDGYHVAYEISSKQESSSPKIIIMTSRDVSTEKGIALLSGAVEVVQKPFSLKDLQSKIDAALA